MKAYFSNNKIEWAKKIPESAWLPKTRNDQ